jgi:hypothetical protein
MTKSKSYTETEEYQREIAEQYKKRVAVFPVDEVVKVCKTLGVSIDQSSVSQATAGNVNATYVTEHFVLKMNKDKKERTYYSNKVAFDALGASARVVEVVAYDFFEQTPYEVLVMRRAPGTMLLNDIFELTNDEQEYLFRQVLDVVKKTLAIEFKDFGNVNSERSFPTYTDYLKYTLTENIRQIREKQLCEESDIAKVEKYFFEHIDIFDNEKAVFVHTDIHMGNILHEGKELTAIIDFDSSLKAAPSRVLLSLLGFIDNPSQFVEGTSDYPKYKGKSFYNLFSVLREELADIFTDSLLLKKLNLLGIREGIDWIAANWSAEWNKEMIANLVNEETPENDEGLLNSYYGKIFTR